MVSHRPKAFREAGEFYATADGMDDAMAATRDGHTEKVQKKNYKKYDAIRAQEQKDRLLREILFFLIFFFRERRP